MLQESGFVGSHWELLTCIKDTLIRNFFARLEPLILQVWAFLYHVIVHKE